MPFLTLQEEETMPFLTLQETMEPTNVGEGGGEMVIFHERPFLHKMPFLTLQEIEWLSMEMERNPKAFLPYHYINSFGVLKIPPGFKAERNHKAIAKTPSRVSEKQHNSDLQIKAYLQEKWRQERYKSKSCVKQNP